MRIRNLAIACGAASMLAALSACSSTKHVPQGEYLLDKVSISIDNDTTDIRTEELTNFLRQTPNHKVLGFAKLQLATYSLSGADTTKWYNRWLRRVGQAPVLYDHSPRADNSNRPLSIKATSKPK